MTASVPSRCPPGGTDASHNVLLGGYCARLIENALHYVKDRWWDEDRHTCRRPGLAAGFTTLLTAALTVVRASGCAAAAGSMRGAVDALCWDVGRAINLMTGSGF